MEELNENLYDRYLNEIFAPAVRDFSKKEALRRFWVIATEELWTAKSNSDKESEESEKAENQYDEELV
ncbi:hypothetical protein [Halorubrum sp. DTA46]|uniref:hypothetical protein n=1 Tax=Halorubrum sp. DTA46 TaxID=3402162 RepID=UPI003AABD102